MPEQISKRDAIYAAHMLISALEEIYDIKFISDIIVAIRALDPVLLERIAEYEGLSEDFSESEESL